MSVVIPPLYEWGLYCNHLVRPSVHTFVTDISASTGRNDFIFDIWLWHGDLYRVSPFQVYRTSTSYFRLTQVLLVKALSVLVDVNLQVCCFLFDSCDTINDAMVMGCQILWQF